MLQTIRDKSKGWIAWVIVIVLSVPFALFGIQQYFEGGGGDAVALVDGDEIPLRDYSREYQNALARLTQERDGQVSPEQEQQLKQQILNQMIERFLLTRSLDASGYAVSEPQLAEAVRTDSRFQEDGRYSKSLLEQNLRYWGLTEAGFAAETRQRLRLQQLESGVFATAPVTDAQLHDFLALEGQTRDFDQITLNADAFRDEIHLETGAVEARYEAERDQLLAPEQVQLEYLDLDAEQLGEAQEPDATAIAAWYEQHQDRFRAPERRRAAHILITVPPDANADARAQARERAAALAQQAQTDADFAALARAHSMDAGTAATGGDLGFVAEGDLDQPLLDAIAGLALDEVSEPVRSTYGWHIVKLTDLQGGAITPLEEARAQVEAMMRAEAGDERFYALGETLANTTYEFPDSLQPAADATGLPIQTSAWLHAQGAVDPDTSPNAISQLAPVRAAAFSEEVLNDRVNSQVIRLGDRRAVVVRVVARKPQRALSLDEVRTELETALIAEAANERARAKSEDIRAAIASGEDPKAAATAAGAKFTDHEGLQRIAFEPTFAVLQEAFRLPKPTSDAPVVATVEGVGGAHHVVVLRRVQEADLSTVTDEERERLRQTIGRIEANIQFDGYLRRLRENAEIEIFPERL